MAVFSSLVALSSMAGTWTLFGSAALGSFAVSAFKTVVGSVLSRLATGKKKAGNSFSVKGQLQRGADLPQSFLVGRSATAGSVVYSSEWGAAGKTPNAFFTMVVTLSDFPVGSLDGIWVNGVRGAMDGGVHADYGIAVSEFTKGGTDYFWVKFYDGTQIAADAFLQDKVSSAERPWDSSAVGRGNAYAIITCRIESALFRNGFPDVLFEVSGAALYDPSRDGSVGGTGAQRWDDPSTWGGDGDALPAVVIYNLLRGISFEGQWFYGLQSVDVAQLPAAHWIGQIEKCRAEVAASSGVEARYRCGGEITVGGQISDALEAFLDACQGRLSEAGGVFKLFCGEPDPAVMSFSDGDIILSEEQSFTPFFGLFDTVNGVSATYPDPAQAWNAEAAPPLVRDDLELEDGARRLLVDVRFDLVPYPEQVQRLMLSTLREARRARRHTHTLPPRFWVLEPGDIVAWTSARNGYDAKLFRVDGVMDKPNADVIVDITEVDPADYDFDPQTDYTPVVPGSVLAPELLPQAFSGWSAEPWTVSDGVGFARAPALLVHWDSDIDDVAAVRVEVRVKATGAIVFSGRFDGVPDGQGVISQGIVADVTYQVRGVYVPASARDVEWSAWLDVLSPDVGVALDDLGADVIAQFAAVGQAASDEIAAARADLEDDIQAARDDATAQVDSASVALQAATAAVAADLATDHYTIAQVDGALSAAQTSLQANIDGVSANLAANYYTSSQADAAITASEVQLVSTFSRAGGCITSQFLDAGAWVTLVDGTQRTWLPNEIFGTGVTWDFDCDGSIETGLYISSSDPTWTGVVGADGLAVEVDFTLLSGDLSGVGASVLWKDDLGGEHYAQFSFIDAVSGPVVASSPVVARAVVSRPSSAVGEIVFNRVNIWANRAAFGGGGAKRIKFHRAQLRDASAEELAVGVIQDDLGVVVADVETLSITKTTEAGAVAAVEQEISASYGSLSGLASATAFSQAGVEGIQSGYIWRARAGGAAGEVELVAADDPVLGASSQFTVDVDRMRFLGGVAMFGGDLRSSDYVADVSGWIIHENGSAEFNDLVAREWIRVGAVSDGGSVEGLGPITASNLHEVAKLTSLGASALAQFWHVSAAWEMAGSGSARTRAQVQYRAKKSGVWGGWTYLYSTGWRAMSDGFAQFSSTTHYQGVAEDLEFRLVAEVEGGVVPTSSNFRNWGLTGQALVR